MGNTGDIATGSQARKTSLRPVSGASHPPGRSDEAAAQRRASGGLTLAEARAARVVWRGLVRIGQHPRLARQAARLAAVRTQANTFQALADEFVDKRGRKWTKPHRDRFRRFMTRDVFPHIGHLPISTITAAQVLAVLRIVEERGTIQAANLGRGFIGAVFRYAVATQKATVDPVPSLRGALATAERKHHQPLDRGDIKPFLRGRIGCPRQSRDRDCCSGCSC